MRSFASLLTLASTAAAIKGFNYGATFTTGAVKQQADFEAEFTAAQTLEGTSGWTSARLYTTVQGGTASDPISAIPAAIKTKTTLLLGLWASAGDESFANEIKALRAAIDQYGDAFTSLVDGISVGSEDLYRNSPTGIAAGSYVGAEPSTLARYIRDTREAIKGTALENSPIGHVDTWTAWVNGTNQAVIDASDWLGMDAYPYFQDTVPNDVSQSNQLFQEALASTQAAGGSKPVWITETGHPVSGKTVGQSIASADNAETFWKDVVCPLVASGAHLWYYTLQDAAPDTPDPSFGIVGNKLSNKPLFDLSCSNSTSGGSSSSSSAPSSSATKPPSSSTASGAGASATQSATQPAGNTGGGEGSSTPTSAVPNPGSTGTIPGSGSDSGSGSGSGSGAGTNGTFTAPPAATSTVPVTGTGATGMQSGAFVAAFTAIMAAIFAL
ncbi:glycoside hydrolase family 17 protein [Durotheca rogersii]|uniref:glycoside hydrolase family 17 protein n=1 Tax=Durotheca rogersii TaxID=419775 RepID=UPI00221F80F1|nr:glycoside hydrolase family 17 protein [Durotheca rogersii]KAI5868515.1 glycoside hydrolase family 17 protein [Durotheca rogersii]